MAAGIQDYWISFAVFMLFGLLHSVAAQDAFKRKLADLAGQFFVDHFWRFIYCLLSFAALYYVFAPLHWSANPGANVWMVDYPEWLWRALLLAHYASIAIIYASFLQSDYLEFWGVKQMVMGFRAIAGRPVSACGMPLFGTRRLETEGVYRWIRHPMLSGGLLFILTAGPSKNNLVFAVYYIIYMLAGAYFEERRLIRVFGDHYLIYRRSTGAFLPKLLAASREGAGRG